MNAQAIAARRIVKQRSASTRAAARIHRNGEASLTTHALAAGLPIREARSVAGSLRRVAVKCQIVGRAVTYRVKGRVVAGHAYSPAEVTVIALNYRARKPAYKVAAARMSLAA